MSELEFLKHQNKILRQILDKKLGLIGHLTSQLNGGILHEMQLEEAQLELGRIEHILEQRGHVRSKGSLAEEIEFLLSAPTPGDTDLEVPSDSP